MVVDGDPVTPAEADRRFTRGVLAIALTGGAACWAIAGLAGAAWLLGAVAVCVLVMAAGARAVGAGDRCTEDINRSVDETAMTEEN